MNIADSGNSGFGMFHELFVSSSSSSNLVMTKQQCPTEAVMEKIEKTSDSNNYTIESDSTVVQKHLEDM